jgi:hypothetical protein
MAASRFEKNVGKTDRIIRLILGIVIIAVGIYFNSWWGLLGLILIFTAITARCALYYPFGINTCRVKQAKGEAEAQPKGGSGVQPKDEPLENK